jgi:hypothetical protein
MRFIKRLYELFRSQSVDLLKDEERELTHLFNFLLFAPLVGVPIVPPMISLELLPYLLDELPLFERKEADLDDILGNLLGSLPIG